MARPVAIEPRGPSKIRTAREEHDERLLLDLIRPTDGRAAIGRLRHLRRERLQIP